MRAYVQTAVGAALAALLAIAGCSNNQDSCSAPSSGTFQVTLSYSQTIPVDLFCDAGDIDASACSSRPHPLEGASWTVVVSGNSATVRVAGADGAWNCTATGPRSAPNTQPDGSTQAGTGCYLLLECGTHAVGDAGTAQVQLQILAPSSTDALVVVHDVASDCCTDEYTGAWH